MISGNLVTVPGNSTVAEALSRMRKLGVHQVPVMNGKRYSGMLSYREVLRRRSIRSNSKVEGFMIKTAKLTPNTDIMQAVKLLKNSGLSALPVVEAGLLVGILSRTDVLRSLSHIVKPGEIKSLDVMSHDPVVITENEPIERALEKFRALDETEMPVVSTEGKYIGILRLDELATSGLLNDAQRISSGEYGREPEKLNVDTASFNLLRIKATRETSIEDCATLMVENRIRALPVVDAANKVLGVIATSDIIDLITPGETGEGILINVSGLEAWDEDLYDILFYNSGKFVSRLQKLANVRNGHFDIHVAKYRSEGRTKFSIRTRLVSGGLNMSINDYDWNFGKCFDRILETYEGRLSKRREK